MHGKESQFQQTYHKTDKQTTNKVIINLGVNNSWTVYLLQHMAVLQNWHKFSRASWLLLQVTEHFAPTNAKNVFIKLTVVAMYII